MIPTRAAFLNNRMGTICAIQGGLGHNWYYGRAADSMHSGIDCLWGTMIKGNIQITGVPGLKGKQKMNSWVGHYGYWIVNDVEALMGSVGLTDG